MPKAENTVDGKKVGHRFIRRVSIDRFYALVTGQKDAFYRLCMHLPEVIQRVVDLEGNDLVPHDTVVEELIRASENGGIESRDLAILMPVYYDGL